MWVQIEFSKYDFFSPQSLLNMPKIPSNENPYLPFIQLFNTQPPIITQPLSSHYSSQLYNSFPIR